MRRFRRLRLPSSTHVRALAVGLAGAVVGPALSNAASERPGSMPPGTIVMAQLDIPTSPSFRMNVGSTVTSDVALPIGSHDVPAKSAPATMRAASGKPAAARAASDKASADASRPTADKALADAPRSAPGKSALAHAGARTPDAAASSSAAAVDPFVHLRERLAQTLGATPAGPSSQYVMQVSNRGETGENVVSTAHAEHGSTLAQRRTAAARGSSSSASATATATSSDGTAAAATEASGSHTSAWDYAGANGPDAWSRLQPGFDKCATGSRQSPIDIREGIAVDLEPIQFDYHPGSFTVVDTGHTVQVSVPPGSSITIQGRRYELQQFHFHRPSEERIDGRRFDMSVHLVHRDADGRLAVIAVLLERGSALPIVQSVWNNLPLEKNDPVRAAGPLEPAQLLPEDRRYYTYMGSLTTPPCTEGVLWMVMKRPAQISNEQDAIFARLYPMNARPLQAASGRLIKESQ
jgi:carbonic anhydrase